MGTGIVLSELVVVQLESSRGELGNPLGRAGTKAVDYRYQSSRSSEEWLLLEVRNQPFRMFHEFASLFSWYLSDYVREVVPDSSSCCYHLTPLFESGVFS